MVSSKFLALSAIALLPFGTAAPAPAPQTVSVDTAAIDWTPVDFKGKTIYINSAALVGSSANPARTVARNLASVHPAMAAVEPVPLIAILHLSQQQRTVLLSAIVSLRSLAVTSEEEC